MYVHLCTAEEFVSVSLLWKMLFSVVLILVASVHAFGKETLTPAEVLSDNLKKVGQANNYFAVSLHRKLSAGSEDNIFFSPFTLSSVLSMLYHGARGETAQELRKILGYYKTKLEDEEIFSTIHFYLTQFLKQMNPNYYTISSASAVIVDSSFKVLPEYKAKVQMLYDAYVQEADIAEDGQTVVKKLNSWVTNKTKGVIDNLVEVIDPSTTVLLASAGYFKGTWRTKFDPQDSKYHAFYNGGLLSDKSDVLMMHKCASFRYYDEDDFQAIELPYEGKNISMVIFLPVNFGGLPLLEQLLTPSGMAFVRRNMYFTKVHLTLPKFKLEFDQDLSDHLQSVGLIKLFGSEADLSGMTQEKSPLTVPEVRHKAVIDVNEKGSVAASVSSLMITKMLPVNDTEPEFKVNHPFLFAIFDTRNNMIIFMGRVHNMYKI